MNPRSVIGGFLILVFGGYLLSGCLARNDVGHRVNSELKTVQGRVEPARVTSFMYGSHLLYDQSGELRYALSSEAVNLNEFVGQGEVRLQGRLKKDYPVDNGPPYLEVLSGE